MTDAPAACNISISGTPTTTPTDHLHVVNLVDRHLQVEQPAC